MLIPIVISAVVKAVRGTEESQSGEVFYKNLDVIQIYGKIIKKY